MILYNAIRTPDGTVLESRYCHDYRGHTDAVSNEYYMVDGGLDYIRRSVNKIHYEELTLTLNDDHLKVRDTVVWGTHGKSGDEPLKYVKLKDLENDHIRAILETQTHIKSQMKTCLERELSFRGTLG